MMWSQAVRANPSNRSRLIGLFAALVASASNAPLAFSQTVGVTPTSIKIGGTFPFSGPASALGNTGKGLIAFINQINARGGINKRKIEYIALDDGYSPPKAVEQTRKLVEQDEVAFMFGPLGTASNAATIKYLNSKQIPDAFIMTGAARFTAASEFPYTTTALPSYLTEGKIYAKFIRTTRPNAKVGVLFQNDDLGKDLVAGLKLAMGDAAGNVLTQAYEVADPTVDSQLLNLRSAGAEVLFIAATPKFAAQAIKKTAELGWKPLQIINLVSSSISATLKPAGVENAVGVVSSAFYKDMGDPRWKDDAGVKDYLAFAEKYLPGSDPTDINYVTGYNQGMILEKVLEQCGDDLSRESINKQIHNIEKFALPMVLPGITVTTSATNNSAFTQLQLQKWTGAKWELFGDVISADAK
jgi:branched-chain amino acid transport system substrate-binding protein